MQLLPPGLYKKHKDLGTSQGGNRYYTNGIQGGRGWVIDGVQVSTIVGDCTAGLYSIELLPGQVTEAWILRCHDWSGNLLWRRFKM